MSCKVPLTNSVFEKEMLVCQEVCFKNQFSFCWDSHEQIYRFDPYLIEKNNLEMNIDSAYNVVYSTLYDLEDIPLLEKYNITPKIKNQFPETNETGFINTICVYDKKLAKYIDDKYKAYFFSDGFFCYRIYKVKLRCLYLGKKDILIPNFGMKSSKGVIRQNKSDVYYIIDYINVNLVKVK